MSKTKKVPFSKTVTKNIAFRDMIHAFHCFGEELNMAQAQDRDHTHDMPVRATKTLTDDSMIMIYQSDKFMMTIGFQLKNKKEVKP